MDDGVPDVAVAKPGVKVNCTAPGSTNTGAVLPISGGR
jgi:hypothetical protein